MADQNFRDVNTVVLHGTAITGVEVVRLGDEGDELQFNADAIQFRQDVALTRQVARVEIERKSSAKLRDILAGTFTSQQGSVTGSIALGRIQRLRISQAGGEISDSGDAASWLQYLGVTDINGRIEATFRDLAQLDTGVIAKGKKGTFVVTVPISRVGFGLPAGTATETHTVVCMCKELEYRSPHGEVNEARAVFEMYGATDPWTEAGTTGGDKTKPVSVGAVGTISWVAPAGDAGSGEAVSVANCLITGIDLDLAHGEYARATYRAGAYSSDGATSPIS